MPYYAEKSGKTWRLTWRLGKTESRSVNKKSDEARTAGFSPEMTYEQAKERAKQLQAEEWVKVDARKHARTKAITEKYKKLRSAFLTDADAEEFETTYLVEHKIQKTHWNTMQKIIVGCEMHPTAWFKRKSRLYAEFEKLHFSSNYAKKLLRYLNIWGYFLCEKQGRAFLKVPGLDGSWKNRLEAHRRTTGSSLPLSPELLKEKKDEIENPAHYNWLFISVWFGLRPREINNLKKPNPKLWYLRPNKEFGWVLSIFQEKLHERGVPESYCWKHIPTVFQEQRRVIEIIEKGSFEYPWGRGGKFMHNTFGRGFTHYAGRNNFSGMLRDAGYDRETRRHWMGHLSIKTTEDYDRKTELENVFYTPPAPKKSAA
jgi:hypothetical protein